jgi:hypothetical protein
MPIVQQDHVSVNTQPDGLFVWVINRTDGKLGTTGRTTFRSFDAAADAALNIAEAKGLPLAADVSIFLDMASPWYSSREMEEVMA